MKNLCKPLTPSAPKQMPGNRYTTVTNAPERQHRLLRLPEVLSRVGLSKSTIYARVAAGSFPASVRLGEKSVAWIEADVEAWIQERIAQASMGVEK